MAQRAAVRVERAATDWGHLSAVGIAVMVVASLRLDERQAFVAQEAALSEPTAHTPTMQRR